MKSLKVVIFQSEQVPEINVTEATLQAYRTGSLTDLDAAELKTMIESDPHLQKYCQCMDDALDQALDECLALASEDTSDLVDQSISLPYIPTHDQVCAMCDEGRIEIESLCIFAHPSDDDGNFMLKADIDHNQWQECERYQNVYEKDAEPIDNLV